MIAWVIAIGRMLGLGSIGGIRPSLTLAVIGVVSHFDWGAHTNATFAFLGYWLTICIFVVLAILESAFDKIAKLDRVQDRLIMPYRLVMGGVAGAATIPFGWRGVVVGAAVGAFAAWFAQNAKRLSRPKSVSSDAVVTLISTAEDLGAFVGSLLVLVVPYFGYSCACVTAFASWRVNDRRRSKYRKLRRAARRAAEPASRGADQGSPDDTGPVHDSALADTPMPASETVSASEMGGDRRPEEAGRPAQPGSAL